MKVLRPILLMAMSFFIAFGILVTSPAVADPPEDSPGAHIYRFEDFNWFLLWANGMAGFVGVDIHAVCIGNPTVNIWDAMIIENPSDLDLFMSHWKGDDLATFIYPEAALAFTPEGNIDVPYLCGYHFDFGPIASGTSDAIVNDNDVFAWRTMHKRANSFNMNASGVLYAQSGDPVAFAGGVHCVWKPSSANFEFRCKDRLTLGD